MDIAQGNKVTFQVNQPQSLGKFTGSAAGNVPKDAFKGDVSIDTSQAAARSDGTVFAMQLLLENALTMKVFQYETSVLNGGASLNARIPHTLRIAKSGSGLAVTDGDLSASVDADVNGSIAGWEGTDTFAVGPSPEIQTIHTTSSDPPERDAPNENGFAVFGGRNYIQCSRGGGKGNLTCPGLSDLGRIDPGLNGDVDDGSSPRIKRWIDAFSKRHLHRLEKRVGGERSYDITFNLVVIATIFSHTYWTGGRELLQHNPNAGYFDINNDDCVDTTWDGTATVPTGVRPAAEHILELQTHPRFIEFAMGQAADLRNGATHRTRYTPIDSGVFRTGGLYLQRWSVWDPAGSTNAVDETPADDVWRAYGDTNNADHMVNAEPHFNGVKQRIVRGQDPVGDDTWQARGLDDTGDPNIAEAAIGAIRDVLALSGYMNQPDVHDGWIAAANGIRAAFVHFQDRYNRNVPNGQQPIANLPEIWDEYVREVLVVQIQNTAAAWALRRVNILISLWDAAQDGADADELVVIRGILEALSVLRDAARAFRINTSGLT